MVKKFKDLNLNNAFLFAAFANDPDACQLMLELILGRKIPKVNVKTEHSILLNSETKFIRLDVNARSEYDVNYNVEAQNSDEHNIVRRSRFYQAQLDVAELKPGDDYNKLPESYVMFICTFDPFGRGLYRYTFIERCEEDGEPLGDGTCKIFFNTKGKNKKDVPKELVEFLGYFEDTTDEYVKQVNNPTINKLHEKIVTLKKSREWEAGYMQMEEYIAIRQRKAREEGLAEGLAEGREEGRLEGLQLATINAIITVLSAKGNVTEVIRDKLQCETDLETLNKWLSIASIVTSIKEFEEQLNEKLI